ncbi:hypothetical protein [Subtercola vilae]|uniref:Phosphotyrosine protein phosphatase I domain-containing protein n=1 Tax=Subtercola vilae TaxID=2056433 RepID=A0A4T2C091_9MICO|nr:hypothetical protein [Subtercola vilae]TIH35596.1 hypothetical protein D4765_11070 [Subtercola vilae]
MAAREFAVMFVCTGNICRSPLAEQLLTAGMRANLQNDVVVTSAGLQTIDGVPMDPLSAQQSVLYGGDPSNAISHKVDRESSLRQDLILTMTRKHQTDIVSRYPNLLKRTFLLREFAEIVEVLHTDSEADTRVNERRRRIVVQAAMMRGQLTRGSIDFDIIDPYRKSVEVHATVGESIHRATSTLAELFR